jgi:hypothetical protein
MDRTYYKLDVQGIVYLVDPATSDAYTYDLSEPTKIGKITWSSAKEAPRILLVDDWQDIMQRKFEAPVQPLQ